MNLWTPFRKSCPTFCYFHFFFFKKELIKETEIHHNPLEVVFLSTLNDNILPETTENALSFRERRGITSALHFRLNFHCPFFFSDPLNVQIFYDALMCKKNCFHANKESFCIMGCKKYPSLNKRTEKSGTHLYCYFNPTKTSGNRYYWVIQHHY